jgi:Ca2+-binding RTX toxin-like protein
MDFLWGGADRDYLFGENGTDEMHGGQGDDMLWGGDDGEQLFGDDGNDYLYGEHGDDTMEGGLGRDNLEGGTGQDTLYGGADNDQLYGQDGDDRIYGGDGDDRLEGGAWQDSLEGGAGIDMLYGGTHSDYLAGGSGADRFIFKATDVTTSVNADGTVVYKHDRDVIHDFSREEGDTIDIGSMLLYVAGFNGTAQQAIDQGYLRLIEGPGRGGTQVSIFIDQNGFEPNLPNQGTGTYVAILSGTTLAEVGAEDFLVTSFGTNTQPVTQAGYFLAV